MRPRLARRDDTASDFAPVGADDARWAEAAEVIRAHRATELGHLAAIETILPPGKRSALVPIWKAAGFALGLSAIVSPRAFFITTDHVETFVEAHYSAQLRALR